MTFVLGGRSRQRLDGVHKDLVRVVERAIIISSIDFSVIEGLRSKERQRLLLSQGATRTMASRHITGHAVDLAPYVDGRIEWEDVMKFRQVGHAMRAAAQDVGVPLVWGALKQHGGHWSTFNDMPHYQLPRASYPAP